jgi:peptide/nickel transport system substrate-binding protein
MGACINGRPPAYARTLLRAAPLWVAALLVALLPAPAGAAPRRGGILDFAVSVEPKSYDCDANTSFAFLHPIAPFYSTLLKFDAAHYPQIVGDLARSWQVSPDHLTYIFKLRPNVLFQDGSPLTSADIKASYERIIHPPPGVTSARRVDYAAIAKIEAPDPLTVVFHLRWPDAAMLANFASPWNCIYSAARLAQDPDFPEKHILGTGAFVFVKHVEGQYLEGKRWDKYFVRGEPYLDGYRALFIKGPAEMKAYLDGHIMADFRGVSPVERDRLKAALGNRVTISESPWLSALLVVFNTKQPPFNDARVRRALSLAIDRWGAAKALGRTTFLEYVGGLMRPGSAWATPPAQLAKLPGFGHDIAAAQAEARRLLAEAGVPNLKLTLLVRKIPMPHYVGAALLEKSWRAIGVTTKEVRLSIWDWQKRVARGDFDVAQAFQGDYYDDPTIQLTQYVSQALSPVDYSGANDPFLDALYIGQAVTPDPQQRLKIVRAFERHELTEAYTVPLLWWNRIVATSAQLRGWYITPSHFIGQDLAGVWIDPSRP